MLEYCQLNYIILHDPYYRMTTATDDLSRIKVTVEGGGLFH